MRFKLFKKAVQLVEPCAIIESKIKAIIKMCKSA